MNNAFSHKQVTNNLSGSKLVRFVAINATQNLTPFDFLAEEMKGTSYLVLFCLTQPLLFACSPTVSEYPVGLLDTI